jgi:tripartite-type tricarboxylate transporter receptor subunit TctC
MAMKRDAQYFRGRVVVETTGKSLNSRRQFFFVAAGAGLAAVSAKSGTAQTFPTRPVTLIVPFSAGGTTDVVLRALAAASEKHLGQSILIENRGGAGGTLGPALMAATARPDGYTLSQISYVLFRDPAIRKTNYDPATDLATSSVSAPTPLASQ